MMDIAFYIKKEFQNHFALRQNIDFEIVSLHLIFFYVKNLVIVRNYFRKCLQNVK